MNQTPSVDAKAARSWIYPTNYPIRKYQQEISEQALFNNTLVCLPTGLGKTLIASVVIYNYYRWFPKGKILFMAPTRPLVNQQMSACTDIMGIPTEDVVLLEGSISAEKRSSMWRDHRVIFCTPQTAQNDLRSERMDPRSIVCVVVDEAHKATGSYAYSIFLEDLGRIQSNFRVLALSATPGTDLRKVQEVVRNLRISRIELRTEDDPDVAPFVHHKDVEVVRCEEAVVSGPQQIRDELHGLLARPLADLQAHGLVVCATPQSLNRLVLREIEESLAAYLTANDLPAQLERALRENGLLLRVLLDCKRLLSDGSSGPAAASAQQDARAVKELAGHLEQLARTHNALTAPLVHGALTRLLGLARRFQGPNARTLARQQPKIAALREVLLRHFAAFAARGESTRVIVFVHLRSTAMEVKAELAALPKEAGVRPREFVGQGASSAANDTGLTQAEQAAILRQFNSGAVNVLVATSIAEEGLDIAEVDLIALLDAVASPTRLVQRCGRTGRKRAGRVVIIESSADPTSASSSSGGGGWPGHGQGQGQEEDKFEASLLGLRSLNELLRRANRTLSLWPHNPRLLPPDRPLPALELRRMGRDSADRSSLTASLGQGDGSPAASSRSAKTIAAFFQPAAAAATTPPRPSSSEEAGEADPFAFHFEEAASRHVTQRKASARKRPAVTSPLPLEVVDVSLSQPSPAQTLWAVDQARPLAVSLSLARGGWQAVCHSAAAPADFLPGEVLRAARKRRRVEAAPPLSLSPIATAESGRSQHLLPLEENGPPFSAPALPAASPDPIPPPQQRRPSLRGVLCVKKSSPADPNPTSSSRPPLAPRSSSGQPTPKPVPKPSEPGPGRCCVCLMGETTGPSPKKFSLLTQAEDSDEEADEAELNPLVRCQGPCGAVCHLACYRGEEAETEDDQEVAAGGAGGFLCDGCEFRRRQPVAAPRTCGLCFQSAGLLRQSTDGRGWAHPVCALWTPELTLSAADHRPNNLAALDPDRADLLCRLCRERGGAAVQCKFADCTAAFHPFCLLRAARAEAGQLFVWESRGRVFHDLLCGPHRGRLPARHLLLSTLLDPAEAADEAEVVCLGPATPSGGRGGPAVTLSQAALTDSLQKGRARPAEEDGRGVRKRKRLKKAVDAEQPRPSRKGRQRPRGVAHFFESEAEESEDAADQDDDDEEEDEEVGEEERLSGDFINDGPVSQATPRREGLGMYLALNRRLAAQQSPEAVDQHGRLRVADLMLRRGRRVYGRQGPRAEVFSLDNSPADRSPQEEAEDLDGFESSFVVDDDDDEEEEEETKGVHEDEEEAEFSPPVVRGQRKVAGPRERPVISLDSSGEGRALAVQRKKKEEERRVVALDRDEEEWAENKPSSRGRVGAGKENRPEPRLNRTTEKKKKPPARALLSSEEEEEEEERSLPMPKAKPSRAVVDLLDEEVEEEW